MAQQANIGTKNFFYGLGGTTKGMADTAVRSDKAVIQHADDFFKWAVESNLKGIKFLFV